VISFNWVITLPKHLTAEQFDEWYLGIGSGERTIGGCVLLYRSQDLRHWEYLHKLVQGS